MLVSMFCLNSEYAVTMSTEMYHKMLTMAIKLLSCEKNVSLYIQTLIIEIYFAESF